MRKLWHKIRSLPRYAVYAASALIAFLALIYYPIGMAWVHEIDDAVTLPLDRYHVEGGSYAVSTAISLIDREVNQNRWVSSDPFVFPGAMLTRMPAFQRGILGSISRFSIEMYDQISRTRGSSQSDADLQTANGLLNYSPYVWMFDFNTSWLPTASSPTQYRAGLDALKNYNLRLSKGAAVFERRSDNLIQLLDRIAFDLGSSSASIASFVDTRSGLSFTDAAELFYNNKGRLYANYHLLTGIKRDFADLIAERQINAAWEGMLESLHDGMLLSNFFIINAAPDSQFMPNHLANQGFYVLRARTQIREITNILMK